MHHRTRRRRSRSFVNNPIGRTKWLVDCKLKKEDDGYGLRIEVDKFTNLNPSRAFRRVSVAKPNVQVNNGDNVIDLSVSFAADFAAKLARGNLLENVTELIEE